MALNKIYYAKPSITSLELEYIANASREGWGMHCYDYIERFEEEFAIFIGCKYVIATSSATGALHLGLAALQFRALDEIIVADTGWIASIAPAVHLGLKPVFVDILPDTWCLDPSRVEAAITAKTKAILAVHLYGNLCDMDRLEEIAKKHNLYLIEDAAEAIGSYWGKRHAGSRGLFGVFSFHGTKTMTTGEGGALVTNDKALADRVRMLNNHGRMPGDQRQFWASEVGYKFKMGNIQAALGCAQLERIGELIQRKREIFYVYQELLAGSPVRLNPVPHNGEQYGYWMPAAILPAHVSQQTALQKFADAQIDGRAFFAPLSQQAHFEKQENPVAYDVYRHAINLPSYHDMTDTAQQRVANIICSL